MKFKVEIYFDSKVVVGVMEVTPKYHTRKVTREIMKYGRLDKTKEIKEDLKEEWCCLNG